MKQRQRIIKQGTKGVDSTRKKIPIYITHIFLRYYTHIQSINITIHISLYYSCNRYLFGGWFTRGAAGWGRLHRGPRRRLRGVRRSRWASRSSSMRHPLASALRTIPEEHLDYAGASTARSSSMRSDSSLHRPRTTRTHHGPAPRGAPPSRRQQPDVLPQMRQQSSPGCHCPQNTCFVRAENRRVSTSKEARAS
jgi:hypothetical protein